jgi:hypothetical protein
MTKSVFQINRAIVDILLKEEKRQGGTPLVEPIEILRWELLDGEDLDVDFYEPERGDVTNITNTTVENEVLLEHGLDPSLLVVSFKHGRRDELVAKMYNALEDEIEEEDNSKSIHIVQLMYTSPTGYSEDRNNVVAAFTSEDRARLFVEWAERQRKDIFKAYHRLKEEVDISKLDKKLGVHSLIRMILPTDGYGTDNYHFQYDDEYDLDPVFG